MKYGSVGSIRGSSVCSAISLPFSHREFFQRLHPAAPAGKIWDFRSPKINSLLEHDWKKKCSSKPIIGSKWIKWPYIAANLTIMSILFGTWFQFGRQDYNGYLEEKAHFRTHPCRQCPLVWHRQKTGGRDPSKDFGHFLDSSIGSDWQWRKESRAQSSFRDFLGGRKHRWCSPPFR